VNKASVNQIKPYNNQCLADRKLQLAHFEGAKAHYQGETVKEKAGCCGILLKIPPQHGTRLGGGFQTFFFTRLGEMMQFD